MQIQGLPLTVTSESDGHETGLKIKNSHLWNQTPFPRGILNSDSMTYVSVPKLSWYQHYLWSTLPQRHTQVWSNFMSFWLRIEWQLTIWLQWQFLDPKDDVYKLKLLDRVTPSAVTLLSGSNSVTVSWNLSYSGTYSRRAFEKLGF